MGGSAADADRFPYHTRLNVTATVYGEFSVSGTLIAPDVVLTDAYSVADGLSVSGDDVVLGIKAWVNTTTKEKSPYEYERSARFWLVHPDYDAESVAVNNIALVFLDEPVMDVPLPKLNKKASIPETGQTLTEIGLGVTKVVPARIFPERLQEVSLNIVFSEACEEATDPLPEMNMNTLFCAGGDHKGGCHGDNGGPLLLLSEGGSTHGDKDVVVGLYTYMTVPDKLLDEEYSDCNLPGYPSGFTRVSVYAEWIHSNVRKYSRVKQSKKAQKGSKKGKVRKYHKF